MKKIILALMMIFAFANAKYVVTTNGNTYYVDDSIYDTKLAWIISYYHLSDSGGNYTYGGVYQHVAYSGGFNLFVIANSKTSSDIRYDFYTSVPSTLFCSSPKILFNGQCVSIPTCTADEKLDTATNTCVPKTVDTNNTTCDPIASQFTNSTTGKCDECMSFTSFSGRASCACNAYGSTYTPVKGVAYYYTLGNYTYKKQRVKCDDGVSETFVYYDPLNNNPQDYNTTTPSDSNTTTPSDNNTTTSPVDLNGTVVPTPSQADVVNALKSIENGQKDSNTALKELGVDLKTVNTQLTQQGYTFNSILDKIIAGNEKADSRYKLMDDEFKGQTQYRNMMGKWVDDDLKNASAQLGATVGVKDAVNTQGTAITDKLGEILKAIKDSNGTGKEGNGTDMTPTNDLLEKIKGDTNATVKGLDKLHEDINGTNSLLDKISGFFDNNDSYKTPDVNGTEFELSDLLPDESWFETNKLNLNFNNYGGDCYCQTAEFTVAGRTFVFPPQEALDVIPFTDISNIFMAFIFVLGAKDFLRD